MSDNKIENQICEAVELIASKIINQANYDKTISAKIISCEDSSTGKYKLKYQDSLIYAYTTSNQIYQKDQMVHVLVPEGDMGAEKSIIGLVANLGANYLKEYSDNQLYYHIGNDCINDDKRTYLIKLDSNISEYSQILYDKSSQINIINSSEIYNNYIKKYFEEGKYFCLGGSFRTQLTKEQLNGNYGLKITILCQTQSGSQIEKEYILDINNMSGDPFNYTDYTQQERYFSLGDYIFQQVDKIEFFVKNFKGQSDTSISLQDLTFFVAGKNSEKELTGYNLILSTPEGKVFNKNIKDDTKKIVASIYLNGVEINTQLAEYYWFMANEFVTETHEKYDYHGGIGWERITIDNRENVFLLPADTFFGESIYIKCVAAIGNQTFSREACFYKENTAYSIKIINNQQRVYSSEDKVSIKVIPLVSQQDQTRKAKFQWIQINKDNYPLRYSTDQEITINASDIDEQSKFRCGVTINGIYVGSKTVEVYNSISSGGELIKRIGYEQEKISNLNNASNTLLNTRYDETKNFDNILITDGALFIQSGITQDNIKDIGKITSIKNGQIKNIGIYGTNNRELILGASKNEKLDTENYLAVFPPITKDDPVLDDVTFINTDSKEFLEGLTKNSFIGFSKNSYQTKNSGCIQSGGTIISKDGLLTQNIYFSRKNGKQVLATQAQDLVGAINELFSKIKVKK